MNRYTQRQPYQWAPRTHGSSVSHLQPFNSSMAWNVGQYTYHTQQPFNSQTGLAYDPQPYAHHIAPKIQEYPKFSHRPLDPPMMLNVDQHTNNREMHRNQKPIIPQSNMNRYPQPQPYQWDPRTNGHLEFSHRPSNQSMMFNDPQANPPMSWNVGPETHRNQQPYIPQTGLTYDRHPYPYQLGPKTPGYPEFSHRPHYPPMMFNVDQHTNNREIHRNQQPIIPQANMNCYPQPQPYQWAPKTNGCSEPPHNSPMERSVGIFREIHRIQQPINPQTMMNCNSQHLHYQWDQKTHGSSHLQPFNSPMEWSAGQTTNSQGIHHNQHPFIPQNGLTYGPHTYSLQLAPKTQRYPESHLQPHNSPMEWSQNTNNRGIHHTQQQFNSQTGLTMTPHQLAPKTQEYSESPNNTPMEWSVGQNTNNRETHRTQQPFIPENGLTHDPHQLATKTQGCSVSSLYSPMEWSVGQNTDNQETSPQTELTCESQANSPMSSNAGQNSNNQTEDENWTPLESIYDDFHTSFIADNNSNAETDQHNVILSEKFLNNITESKRKPRGNVIPKVKKQKVADEKTRKRREANAKSSRKLAKKKKDKRTNSEQSLCENEFKYITLETNYNNNVNDFLNENGSSSELGELEKLRNQCDENLKSTQNDSDVRTLYKNLIVEMINYLVAERAQKEKKGNISTLAGNKRKCRLALKDAHMTWKIGYLAKRSGVYNDHYVHFKNFKNSDKNSKRQVQHGFFNAPQPETRNFLPNII